MSNLHDPKDQERLMQYLQRSCLTDSNIPASKAGSLSSVLSNNSNQNKNNNINNNINNGKVINTDNNDINNSCDSNIKLNEEFIPRSLSVEPELTPSYSNKNKSSIIETKITQAKHLPNTYTDNHNNNNNKNNTNNNNNNNNTELSNLIPTVKESNLSSKTTFDLDTKYCYRHNPRIRCNKMADQKQLTEIQKKLVTFSRKDQQTITNVWSAFANSSSQQRALILQGLISQCCFPQLSVISHEISHLLKIDFLEMLPSELALKILCYLDCQSLCNAAQVSTKWKQLADDDRVWRYMCEQHIDRKCPQCGWGLPLMAVKKLQEKSLKKRRFSEVDDEIDNLVSSHSLPQPLWKRDRPSPSKRLMRRKRPWKAVYSERYTVERHWRKGFYSLKKFEGHKDGVLCCQYDNNKLLMTGSYDTTIKIWNTDTGELIRTLTGHTMGVKSLIFDDQKLITGGLDSTIKVWNWRTGECISSYTGHREGVITVDFLDKVIVSGSADKTIKVWHVDTRTCYTLRGHSDWVTCVKIHAKSRVLFSTSDDSTIRLWDLETNKCINVYGGVENGGHTAQVQCVIPFTYTEELVTDTNVNDELTSKPSQNSNINSNRDNENAILDTDDEEDDGAGTGSNLNNEENDSEYEKFVKTRKNLPTHLITASLDNTIKLWDVKTGKCIRTQFGHIEGVWSIAADTFRIVSGAHDKSIKIWDLQNGQCMHTLVNSSSVTCVGLGDSRVVCGLENGEVKMYCFDCNE